MMKKMNQRIENLTGHDITIFNGQGDKVVVPAKGPKLVVDSRRKRVGYVAKKAVKAPVIILNRKIDRDKLPPIIPGTVYIVSIVAAMAYPERRDFLVPGRKVRDQSGKVIGCLDLRLIV
jgi:hypothetical protein